MGTDGSHPEEKSDQRVTDPNPQENWVGDEGRKVNQELVDLDLRSTFEVVTSK